MSDERDYQKDPQSEEELEITRKNLMPNLPNENEVIISMSSSISGFHLSDEEKKDLANEEYKYEKYRKELIIFRHNNRELRDRLSIPSNDKTLPLVLAKSKEDFKEIFEREFLQRGTESDRSIFMVSLIEDIQNHINFHMNFTSKEPLLSRDLVLMGTAHRFVNFLKGLNLNQPEIKIYPIEDKSLLKEKALKYLVALSGNWMNGEKIMSDAEYTKVVEAVFNLIDVSEIVQIHTQIRANAPKQFIRRLFWAINTDLYTVKNNRKGEFIALLHAYFECFNESDKNATLNNFKEYRNGDFDSHLKIVLETIKK